MGANFQLVIPLLLKAEGGHVDNPKDYGGETKFGISKKQYPNVDIENLTLEEACDILERDYWNRYRLIEIREQIVANQSFLLLINMNPLNAGKIVQKAINDCKIIRPAIQEDGIIGSNTLSTINSFTPYETISLSANLRNEACRYYLQRVDDDPTQIANFRSWIRRSLL